jgi:hypothetical protein
MTSLRIFSLTVCVALLLAGCGSSGSSGGPSKATYVSQADAVCAQGDVQIQSVPKPQLTGSSAQILKNLGSYVDQVLPLAQNVITRLKALKQPSSDRALLQRYFASLDDAVAKLRTLSTAARAGDAKGVQAGANALNSTQPDALARQYGFKRCGGTGGTGTPAG